MMRLPNVMVRGSYCAAFFAASRVAAYDDCADFAMYASLMVTGSVPVRFEKWKRNLFPEKQARIG